MNVYLMGFMGCGKSAVGKILARALGRSFFDTDSEIEKAAGQSVAEIFARSGEKRFRLLEKRAVAQAAKLKDAVVALGGGALLDPVNRRAVSRGMAVRLTCAEGELWRRLKGEVKKRPLIASGRGPFRALRRRRRGAYPGADFSVSTTAKSAARVAREVERRLSA